MGDPPSGTVTFLFTDIESSTRLWEERPDEMRDHVARHDERFRSVIEANGGYVVKGTGDGVHAAFGRAGNAVRAAEQLQDATSDLPFRVRIGINTGEVQERDGDYFGPAVNRAARLMASGHGGQILLSGVTAELVPGLTLRNLGEHRLRDLGSPMLIWQLGTEDFPPLRTLDELPGCLPAQRTTFIGRADEVKELAALVTAERLVTLTGPGGVGKSRLALQVAAEVAPQFVDGAWFVSLASLEERALVAPSLLQALDISERQGETAPQTLRAWVRTHSALIVIDNCEHLLLQVAAVIDNLLEAPASSFVATSQAPLGVRGERVWVVAPLSGPGGTSTDSIELFVDRARMARADFALTADNETAVAEICERLDHIPLAIELAAARVRGMTPRDIAQRLDHRLQLLASPDQLAPGRHRTLDGAVRWSYELLDETQRRVFDRLSVFVGPFTIAAAEVVVSGDGVAAWEVLDATLALVDKSLVVADESADATRYRLLETMRQFGSANLAAAGHDVSYRESYVAYYTAFVLSRAPQLFGSGDVQTVDDLQHELEHIRVALRDAADDRATSGFEDLYCAVYPLWMRGRNTEGASWGTELLDRSGGDPRSRIHALGYAAQVTNPTNLDEANKLAAAAIELSASTGAAPPLIAMTIISLGAMMQGRTEDAITASVRVQTLTSNEPDPFVRAACLSTCLAVFGICNVLDRVEQVRRELEPLVEQLDNRYLDAATTGALAPIIHLVDPENARAVLLDAYMLNEQTGNKHACCTSAMFLALHELRTGDSAAAAQWARRSLETAVDIAPSYLAQTANAIIPIVKRRSPADAAALLGALRAHRTRKQQAGTQAEVDAEARYEASLRRALGDRFGPAYARGTALDEAALINLATNQLDAISKTD